MDAEFTTRSLEEIKAKVQRLTEQYAGKGVELAEWFANTRQAWHGPDWSCPAKGCWHDELSTGNSNRATGYRGYHGYNLRSAGSGRDAGDRQDSQGSRADRRCVAWRHVPTSR